MRACRYAPPNSQKSWRSAFAPPAEGRDGFATTVGVVCDPKKKLKLPQDRAAQVAACWEDEVERALPSGLGSISRDTSMTPASYVVAVSWSAPETGAASYVTRVEVR